MWGRQVDEGKVVAMLNGEGVPMEVYWAPKEVDEECCRALLACHLRPVFIMGLRPVNGSVQLTPQGLCFAVEKPIVFETATLVARLPGGGAIGPTLSD